MDAATGALRRAVAEPVCALGGWNAVSPTGRALYIAVRAGEGPENNYVAAFAIDAASGALAPLGRATTVLPGSPHCAVSADGRTLARPDEDGSSLTALIISQ